MPKKYRVALTAEERKALQHTISVGQQPARKVLPSHILLLVDPGARRLRERRARKTTNTSGTARRTSS